MDPLAMEQLHDVALQGLASVRTAPGAHIQSARPNVATESVHVCQFGSCCGRRAGMSPSYELVLGKVSTNRLCPDTKSHHTYLPISL